MFWPMTVTTGKSETRTINESPVQLYVSGNMQPYEIVINQVTKRPRNRLLKSTPEKP